MTQPQVQVSSSSTPAQPNALTLALMKLEYTKGGSPLTNKNAVSAVAAIFTQAGMLGAQGVPVAGASAVFDVMRRVPGLGNATGSELRFEAAQLGSSLSLYAAGQTSANENVTLAARCKSLMAAAGLNPPDVSAGTSKAKPAACKL